MQSPGSTQIFYVSKILPRTPIIIPLQVCHTGLQLREDQPKLASLQREESNLTLFSSESVLFPLSTPSMGRFVSSSSSSIFSHQTALAALKGVLLFSSMLVTPLTMMYSTWLELPQLLPAELCYKKHRIKTCQRAILQATTRKLLSFDVMGMFSKWQCCNCLENSGLMPLTYGSLGL